MELHDFHRRSPHENGHVVHFLDGDGDGFADVFQLFRHVDGPPFFALVVNDAPETCAEALVGDDAADLMCTHFLVISDW